MSALLEGLRRRVLEGLALERVVGDRLACSLGLRFPGGIGAGDELDPAPDLDSLADGPIFEALCAERGISPGAALAAGYRELARRLEGGGGGDRVLLNLIHEAAGEPQQTGAPGLPIEVPLGRDSTGAELSWAFNIEQGLQTNANTRITGAPGVGKSWFLLHLLAAVSARSPQTGFVLLDYKGDLSTREDFVAATGATVLRPHRVPIPINPFELPAALDSRLIPSSIAALLASLDPRIGPVQRGLLREAVQRAYGSSGTPSSVDIAQAVADTYEEQGRPADSLTSWLSELAELGLFATRSELPAEDFLRRRWIVDLAELGELRNLVAFVLVDWISRAAKGLRDSALAPNGGRRELRSLVAIDEAHHYISRRCGALLELLRIGRSKGLPVVLSSQSLADFRKHTELEEFLPNNFVLRHGLPPELRVVQGAFGLARADAERRTDAISALAQFRAFTNLSPEPMELYGFFDGRWKP